MEQLKIRPLWLERWVFVAIVCLSFLAAGGTATAQEIQPNEFVPLPAGTNIILGYYFYGHNSGFNLKGGPSAKDSGLEVNIPLARYVHFTSLFGMPAGFQIYQAFGSESGGHIGPEGLGSAFGASNPALSAFIWPYANVAKKQYFVITGFIYPPIGTYDKNSALNLASALSNSIGWAGDVQFGWDHGIGDHFSYDLAFDVRAYGDTTGPFPPPPSAGFLGSQVTSKNPEFRLQAWANWRFNPVFQAAIGWESLLGGAAYAGGNGALSAETGGLIPSKGVLVGKSERERLRVAGSMFLSPRSQVLLELNHDFVAIGDFRQVFGATARFFYIF
jgi:hypothetical protein